MKKIIITFALILLAGFMIYLTRPTTQVQAPTPNETATAGGNTHEPEIKHSSSINSPVAMKCDQDALLKSINQLKEQRNQSLKALELDELNPQKLSQLVRKHLSDHQLANEIYKPEVQKKSVETPEQLAIKEFQQQKDKVENIFMAAWAGQADEPLNQFLKGELAPLDPTSELHKLFVLNLLAMSGDKQTVSAINHLYSEDGALTPEVAPIIIQSVKEPKLLRSLLARVTDLNRPVKSDSFFYGSSQSKPVMQMALQLNKFDAANVLLDLGAKPDNQLTTNSLDYFYKPDQASYQLIEKLLNKGFGFSNSAKAKRLATLLAKDKPELAARVTVLADRLKAREDNQYLNLPSEFKQIIDDFKAQHEPLNKQYLACLAQDTQSKPKIPPYQSIDQKKIEQSIDQLIAQKVEYEQIIATLGAINKETVEYGYKYLNKLRIQSRSDELDMMNMPKEVRTLIGYIHQQDWDALVDFMKSNPLDNSWEITPATMVSAMIEKNAPESAILEMVKISNKSDIKLLNQALYQPKLLERIANYGFNLNATYHSNKNLFYQAVTRNAMEQIDTLIGHGVNFSSDPFGYDALDSLLRKSSVNSDLYGKLSQVGFPLTEHHLDYALYLKTHYPERYNKIIAAWPSLKVQGEWQPKS